MKGQGRPAFAAAGGGRQALDAPPADRSDLGAHRPRKPAVLLSGGAELASTPETLNDRPSTGASAMPRVLHNRHYTHIEVGARSVDCGHHHFPCQPQTSGGNASARSMDA